MPLGTTRKLFLDFLDPGQLTKIHEASLHLLTRSGMKVGGDESSGVYAAAVISRVASSPGFHRFGIATYQNQIPCPITILPFSI